MNNTVLNVKLLALVLEIWKTVNMFFLFLRMSDFYDYVVLFGHPTRFARLVQGFECEYYFRKFKKIHTNPDSTITRLGFAWHCLR